MDELEHMFVLKKNQPYMLCLYRAVFATAYHGLFKVGELTASPHSILAQNVHIGVNKNKLPILVESSKTHCKGDLPQIIKINSTPINKHANNHSDKYCPFIILKSYIKARPKRLPKYILILQNKDLITNMKTSKIEAGYVMGAIIYYIIKQIDLLAERHKTDILNKKPGAYCDEHPKIVWVRMLKCPKQEFPAEVHRVISLRGKFNSVLEERLLDAKGSHHIMSILVDMTEFDMWGDLTMKGKYNFWREVDRAMKKFDLNEITLNPRKNENVANKSQLPEPPPKINIREALEKNKKT